MFKLEKVGRILPIAVTSIFAFTFLSVAWMSVLVGSGNLLTTHNCIEE
jgi:hypothetical protein